MRLRFLSLSGRGRWRLALVQRQLVRYAVPLGRVPDRRNLADDHARAPVRRRAGHRTFKVSALKAGEAYEFFCLFPNHAALMKGTLTLK